MLIRMIIVTVPPDRVKEAVEVWKQSCAPTMIQQNGCTSEQLLQDQNNPGELISLQSWLNEEAIREYLASPGHQEVRRHTRDLMGVSDVQVKTYEVHG